MAPSCYPTYSEPVLFDLAPTLDISREKLVSPYSFFKPVKWKAAVSPPIIPGIPCKNCTPQVSCKFILLKYYFI